MASVSEGLHTGEFLLCAEETLSFDEVIIAAAAPAMVPGTLVGKITASGKYAAYNNAANDGTEVAAGILYRAVADKAVDQKAVIVSRHAEVISSLLTGLDTAGRADLNTLMIICR